MDDFHRFLQQIPGFRTGRRWKQIIALPVYGLVALTVLTGGAPGFVFGAGVLLGTGLVTNFKGMRHRAPLVGSENWFGKLSGWVLLLFGGMIALVAVVPPVEPEDGVLDDPISEVREATDGARNGPVAADMGSAALLSNAPEVPPTEPPPAEPTKTELPTVTDEPPTVAPPTDTVVPPTATALPPTVVPTDPPPPPPTDPPPEPTVPPPPPPPPEPAKVVISYIFYDGLVSRTEDDEYAQITNQGGSPVNLGGWRLNAGDPGQDFGFPGYELGPGQSCRVYTNEHHPESCGFSFGRGQAIWNNKGDCGYLYNAEGQEVSKYCY